MALHHAPTGVAGLAEEPADWQRAAEGGELLGRPTTAGVQRALAVPDEELLGQSAEEAQAASDAADQVDPSLENTSAEALARE